MSALANRKHRTGKQPRLTAAIREWLRHRQEEMAALTERLVALPTENPPGNNYRACADLLEHAVQAAGLACERFEYRNVERAPRHSSNRSDEHASCLFASYGSGKPTLYFHGHYDVVPAQSQAQFEPRRQGNFLFGRGSCDMKAGLVAMLYAIRALKECRAELDGKVSLALVCDEETGGARGSAWLAQRGLLGRNGIGMLTAEPTSGVIWHANRGAFTLRVEVLGKSAHVGLQHKGENAFERMHQVVARLLELKHQVERRKTKRPAGSPLAAREAATAGNEHGPGNSILLLGGECGGGTNFNVVPDRCWFTVDRRINPQENFDAEKKRLLNVLEECRAAGVPLRWEVLQEGRSASSGTAEPLAQALASSSKIVTGTAPRFEMCPGLLETRFYAQHGLPAYAYGPGLLSVAHGPNEYVDLRRVTSCSAIYALTALEILAS